jgi:hypothetical protein
VVRSLATGIGIANDPKKKKFASGGVIGFAAGGITAGKNDPAKSIRYRDGSPGEAAETRDRAAGKAKQNVYNINATVNAPGADAGTIARIKEIVRAEMVPQIVKASTESTIRTIQRPRFS